MESLKYFLKQNKRLLLISCFAFVINQAFEFFILTVNGAGYLDLCYWDCPWYASTVQHGYDFAPHGHERGDAANWAFFPALTIVARWVTQLFSLSAPVALIVTSKLFFLAAIFSFLKLSQIYTPRVSPSLCAALLALNPYSLYGNVGYTESMFLLFSCVSLTALRQGRFVSAGLVGAVLSAVRPTGVFIALALLATGLKSQAKASSEERLQMLLGILLAPLGLALFMVFLYWRMGDAMAFSHVQIAWERVPSNPFMHLLSGLLAQNISIQLWAWMSVVALLMIAYLLWRKEYALAMFSLGATLLPLATGLVAMPRYLWWQAPLLLVLAQSVSAFVNVLHRVFVGKRFNRQIQYSPPYWLALVPFSLWGLHRTYIAWLLQEVWVI